MAKRLRAEGTARRAGRAQHGEGATARRSRRPASMAASVRACARRSRAPSSSTSRPAPASKRRSTRPSSAVRRAKRSSRVRSAPSPLSARRCAPRSARPRPCCCVAARGSASSTACGLRALSEAQDRQSADCSCDRRSPGTRRAGPRRSARRASRAIPSCRPCSRRSPRAGSRISRSVPSSRASPAGESNGALLAQLAPMIKESHRISMCVELFVPLVRGVPVAVHVGPALVGAARGRASPRAVARAGRGGGEGGRRHAARRGSLPRRRRARRARASAWSLVAWALSETDATRPRLAQPPPPPRHGRPSSSSRACPTDPAPIATRRSSFAWRARSARRPRAHARDASCATLPLADETAHSRGALPRARRRPRGHARRARRGGRRRRSAKSCAASPPRRLWDASPAAGGENATRMRGRAREIADELLAVARLGNVAWGALIRAAAKGGAGARAAADGDPFPVDPVGLARVAAPCRVRSRPCSPRTCPRAPPTPTPQSASSLWADRDDDDADGRPDGESTPFRPPTHVDLVPIDNRLLGAVLQVVSGGEHARIYLGRTGRSRGAASCQSPAGSRASRPVGSSSWRRLQAGVRD